MCVTVCAVTAAASSRATRRISLQSHSEGLDGSRAVSLVCWRRAEAGTEHFGTPAFLCELLNFVTLPALGAPRLIVLSDLNTRVRRAQGWGDDKGGGSLLYGGGEPAAGLAGPQPSTQPLLSQVTSPRWLTSWPSGGVSFGTCSCHFCLRHLT